MEYQDTPANPVDYLPPSCAYCGRTPNRIPGWATEAMSEKITVDEYARQDGTYNPTTNHFACDDCYIRIGMPSAPGGWVAP